MNHIDCFSDKGLTVSITKNGNLKIQGLSSLPGNLSGQVLEYAKKYKQQILSGIKTLNKIIQVKKGTFSCPAQCKRSGKCYGIAYFDAKPGKALLCISDQCPWSDQLKQYLKRNQFNLSTSVN